ncbi:MAG: hypothetical protein ABL901_05945, partial [Hyphomicrobiaceae bacterium]
MNRREAAEEPSMEDILASIRKIIADDPAPSAAPALPLPQLSPAGFAPAHPRDVQPQFPAAAQPSLTARLNDVFGPGSVVPGDSPQANKPFPSRPLRSVMDDDLGDMLADAPPAPRRPVGQPAPAGKPAPTVIAASPVGSRPFPLDSAAADLLSGRTAIPAPPAPPGSESSRLPQPQSSLYPPNTRLTELRTSQPLQAPASFDTSPSFPPQSIPSHAAAIPAWLPEGPRAAPVVIAAMPSMEQRPLPAGRPFNFVPEAQATPQQAAQAPHQQAAPPAAPVPAATAMPAVAPPPSRPEPVVIASSMPFTAPADQPSAQSVQPSITATLPRYAPLESAAKPAGISAATLDFLMPSARQADPVPPAPAQVDSLPVAPIISASTLDFLKPFPQTAEAKPFETPVEPAPVTVAPPAPQPVTPTP